jgi:hypothetical protein
MNSIVLKTILVDFATKKKATRTSYRRKEIEKQLAGGKVKRTHKIMNPTTGNHRK